MTSKEASSRIIHSSPLRRASKESGLMNLNCYNEKVVAGVYSETDSNTLTPTCQNVANPFKHLCSSAIVPLHPQEGNDTRFRTATTCTHTVNVPPSATEILPTFLHQSRHHHYLKPSHSMDSFPTRVPSLSDPPPSQKQLTPLNTNTKPASASPPPEARTNVSPSRTISTLFPSFDDPFGSALNCHLHVRVNSAAIIQNLRGGGDANGDDHFLHHSMQPPTNNQSINNANNNNSRSNDGILNSAQKSISSSNRVESTAATSTEDGEQHYQPHQGHLPFRQTSNDSNNVLQIARHHERGDQRPSLEEEHPDDLIICGDVSRRSPSRPCLLPSRTAHSLSPASGSGALSCGMAQNVCDEETLTHDDYGENSTLAKQPLASLLLPPPLPSSYSSATIAQSAGLGLGVELEACRPPSPPSLNTSPDCAELLTQQQEQHHFLNDRAFFDNPAAERHSTEEEEKGEGRQERSLTPLSFEGYDIMQLFSSCVGDGTCVGAVPTTASSTTITCPHGHVLLDNKTNKCHSHDRHLQEGLLHFTPFEEREHCRFSQHKTDRFVGLFPYTPSSFISHSSQRPPASLLSRRRASSFLLCSSSSSCVEGSVYSSSSFTASTTTNTSAFSSFDSSSSSHPSSSHSKTTDSVPKPAESTPSRSRSSSQTNPRANGKTNNLCPRGHIFVHHVSPPLLLQRPSPKTPSSALSHHTIPYPLRGIEINVKEADGLSRNSNNINSTTTTAHTNTNLDRIIKVDTPLDGEHHDAHDDHHHSLMRRRKTQSQHHHHPFFSTQCQHKKRQEKCKTHHGRQRSSSSSFSSSSSSPSSSFTCPSSASSFYSAVIKARDSSSRSPVVTVPSLTLYGKNVSCPSPQSQKTSTKTKRRGEGERGHLLVDVFGGTDFNTTVDELPIVKDAQEKLLMASGAAENRRYERERKGKREKKAQDSGNTYDDNNNNDSKKTAKQRNKKKHRAAEIWEMCFSDSSSGVYMLTPTTPNTLSKQKGGVRCCDETKQLPQLDAPVAKRGISLFASDDAETPDLLSSSCPFGSKRTGCRSGNKERLPAFSPLFCDDIIRKVHAKEGNEEVEAAAGLKLLVGGTEEIRRGRGQGREGRGEGKVKELRGCPTTTLFSPELPSLDPTSLGGGGCLKLFTTTNTTAVGSLALNLHCWNNDMDDGTMATTNTSSTCKVSKRQPSSECIQKHPSLYEEQQKGGRTGLSEDPLNEIGTTPPPPLPPPPPTTTVASHQQLDKTVTEVCTLLPFGFASLTSPARDVPCVALGVRESTDREGIDGGFGRIRGLFSMDSSPQTPRSSSDKVRSAPHPQLEQRDTCIRTLSRSSLFSVENKKKKDDESERQTKGNDKGNHRNQTTATSARTCTLDLPVVIGGRRGDLRSTVAAVAIADGTATRARRFHSLFSQMRSEGAELSDDHHHSVVGAGSEQDTNTYSGSGDTKWSFQQLDRRDNHRRSKEDEEQHNGCLDYCYYDARLPPSPSQKEKSPTAATATAFPEDAVQTFCMTLSTTPTPTAVSPTAAGVEKRRRAVGEAAAGKPLTERLARRRRSSLFPQPQAWPTSWAYHPPHMLLDYFHGHHSTKNNENKNNDSSEINSEERGDLGPTCTCLRTGDHRDREVERETNCAEEGVQEEENDPHANMMSEKEEGCHENHTKKASDWRRCRSPAHGMLPDSSATNNANASFEVTYQRPTRFSFWRRRLQEANRQTAASRRTSLITTSTFSVFEDNDRCAHGYCRRRRFSTIRGVNNMKSSNGSALTSPVRNCEDGELGGVVSFTTSFTANNNNGGGGGNTNWGSSVNSTYCYYHNNRNNQNNSNTTCTCRQTVGSGRLLRSSPSLSSVLPTALMACASERSRHRISAFHVAGCDNNDNSDYEGDNVLGWVSDDLNECGTWHDDPHAPSFVAAAHDYQDDELSFDGTT